ncbi:ABC transporter ATP-binding protein [Portibacter lacus]|uniref:ABC transporter ATP-binding protein n=1 Tax=Portibacter lacus TaxID=1099794 RepID=A0AA37STD7_9BACT|nr:ABC transporter ATP-binding protein [Portibacter lacus]GLR18441.1 ABC transporter ATP-binding protein [Portibacter lacus]
MQHSDGQTILEVQKLNTYFGETQVVKDLSFAIQKGETVAIIGETGSGKSVAISSIFNLLEAHIAKVSAEKLVYNDKKNPQISLPKDIAIVFQNAQLSLNPVVKCGVQIKRILRKQMSLSRVEAEQNTKELFHKVELNETDRIYHSFPHQLSGGELQRVMIAMGLACHPEFLILDEPTASLDRIVQIKIIDLLKKLKAEEGLSILLITHDLALVSDFADRILHIDKGALIANQDVDSFFTKSAHQVSQQLVEQLKDFYNGQFKVSGNSEDLMDIKELSVQFRSGKYAFKDLSFCIKKGENLGIIGESGSGKTTLAKCLSGMIPPTEGRISSKVNQRNISYVFQDAYNSVDPDLSIKAILHEVIRLQEKKRDIGELLASVNLSTDILNRKITELSGGQRQRVNLARSLACNPSVLICDEITSGLDLKVQMEIIDLLSSKGDDLTIVFISHDISLVKYFCHRVLIMKNGGMEFLGETKHLFEENQEGYAKELINSIYKVKYFLNRY